MNDTVANRFDTLAPTKSMELVKDHGESANEALSRICAFHRDWSAVSKTNTQDGFSIAKGD
jgi:peptide subunit release factor 1 (eRF1)